MCGQAGAEALVRQGLWEGAIAFAEAVRSSTNPGFFESVREPKLHPSCSQEFLKFVLTAALKQARQADGCSNHMLEGLVPMRPCPIADAEARAARETAKAEEAIAERLTAQAAKRVSAPSLHGGGSSASWRP
jgi:hypothetical protein